MKTLVVTLTILACAYASVADEASHKKAAEAVVALLAGRVSVETVGKNLDACVPRFSVSVSKDEYKKIRGEIYQSVHDDIVAAYVKTFTEAELKELVKFYATTLGQKLLKNWTELDSSVEQALISNLIRRMPELRMAVAQTQQPAPAPVPAVPKKEEQ